jgi:hypothetical protein
LAIDSLISTRAQAVSQGDSALPTGHFCNLSDGREQNPEESKRSADNGDSDSSAQADDRAQDSANY